MSFACPGCEAPIDAAPDHAWLRCPSCGALLRSRPLDSDGQSPAFLVSVVGRNDARRRVELPWDDRQLRRLWTWLAAGSLLTLALVVLLYVLARLRS